MSENNGNKEGKIIAICPICGKKFRDAEGERYIISRYIIAGRPGLPPQISLQKIACLTCGIEVFLLEDLKKLKDKLQGEGARIVKAPANIKIVK